MGESVLGASVWLGTDRRAGFRGSPVIRRESAGDIAELIIESLYLLPVVRRVAIVFRLRIRTTIVSTIK
jgi:hypothetical protein